MGAISEGATQIRTEISLARIDDILLLQVRMMFVKFYSETSTLLSTSFRKSFFACCFTQMVNLQTFVSI